jgi:hypothetical protein
LKICGVFTSAFAFIAYISIILSILTSHRLKNFLNNYFLLLIPKTESCLDTNTPDHAFAILNAMIMPEIHNIMPKKTYLDWTQKGIILIF